jgi:N utilization substance protein A
MTNDIVALIDYYEKEKGIERRKVIEALEFAFISAYRRMVLGAEAIETLRADVDMRKGQTRIHASLRVVADDAHTDKWNEVPLKLAQRRNPQAQPGDLMEFDVTPKDFGRIAVQTAKQTMMQRLRQAEKEMIYEEFKDRAGDIVSGTVRRFERSDVMVDLGKFEGCMPSRERVATEEYNIGDRIRAYVVAVENEGRGPEIILSRSHPNFVRRLFEAEVSEISDRTVEIRGIAREAGYRTKVAVHSNDAKVDPVGACVGLRGARVKNIVRELNNEKVDIIRWSEDPREFVADALKPATLKTITLDQANKVINVTVDESDLSKAIGRRGQNARLSSRLIGWDVQVRKDESEAERFQAQVSDAAQGLVDALGIKGEVAENLLKAGGMTLDLIVQMPADYVAEHTGIGELEAGELLAKARAALGLPPDQAPAAVAAEQAPAPVDQPADEATAEAPAEAAAGAPQGD